jgi:hypothetical protein
MGVTSADMASSARVCLRLCLLAGLRQTRRDDRVLATQDIAQRVPFCFPV